jgi:hypothetical protein
VEQSPPITVGAGLVAIYGLVDPRTDAVRYVGKAAGPKRRLKEHWVRRSGTGVKNAWLRELDAEGLRPVMVILEVVPKSGWRVREADHVSRLEKGGIELLNSAAAGAGPDAGHCQRWSDASAREKLTALCAGRDTWPSRPDFVAAGLGGLEDAIKRRLGGHEKWAAEFGLPRRRRRRADGTPIRATQEVGWTETKARDVLQGLCAGRADWPTASEFRAAGLGGLYQAIQRKLGGHEKWAAEFGLSFRPRAAGWTDASIAESLSAFCSGRSTYPTTAEFVAAGLRGLYSAIAATQGGHAAAAERLGLQKQWSEWTADSARERLREFCAKRATWPTAAEFSAAGLSGLYEALGKRLGGIEYWQTEMNLQPRVRNWTPERARAALVELCRDRDQWPSERQFRAAGLSGLHAAIQNRLGGHDKWAREFGFLAEQRLAA